MKPKTRQEITQAIHRQKAEIAQLLADIESWNDNNRWTDRIDPGIAELEEWEMKLDDMLMQLKK